MADLLQFTVLAFTATELKIKVKNTRGALLDKSLAIEFYFPSSLVDVEIKNAAERARRDPTGSTGGRSVANYITGPAGWSFWAKPQSTSSSLIVTVYNDIDQVSGNEKDPVAFATGGDFDITIKLNSQVRREDTSIVYTYEYDNATQRFGGSLELKSEPAEWSPEVTLKALNTNPIAIKPGTFVKIEWTINSGVSATLYGPLTEGNTSLTLSSADDAVYKIAKGNIQVRVVSTMTYVLRAVVKDPRGQSVEVTRMLTLDTVNSDKYLFVNPRPVPVLPYGLVEIDWSAWGVHQIEIRVGSRETRLVILPGRIPEGSGVMRINAAKTSVSEPVILSAQEVGMHKSENIMMTSWLEVTSQGFSGQPLAMAVAAPKLALLTIEGLFIAEVGLRDSGNSSERLQFTKSNVPAPKQWLALTSLNSRFVALRRTTQDDLEVAPYKLDGSADAIPPVTLPADLRLLVAARGTVFDVVGFGGRAYVVVETVLPSGILRRAFSVAFGTTSAEYRSEPLLETLTGFKLVVFDNALYALHRQSGRMVRFNLSTSGTLEPPLQAASAVTKSQGPEQSMIKEGLIVPVGRVLAVLDPNAIPSLEEIEPYGLRNVLRYTNRQLQAVDPDGNPQDIFYNPQKNYWGRCGHGLDVKSGVAAAFRSGESQRLWVIQQDGKIHTLAVGLESLFVHDFMPGAIPWPLEPYFKKRQITITNTCGMTLMPMNSLIPGPVVRGATTRFELQYNEADSPVQLRFLLESAKGVKHLYLLEINLFGPNLSRARWVIQRLQIEAQGTMSMAEIPGSAFDQSTDVGFHPYTPVRLAEGVTLRMINYTTYQFWQQAPEASDPGAKRYDGDLLTIVYNTPSLLVFGHGAGELHVNVDFSLPTGIEISPGSQPQSKLIRINTDRSKGLYPELLPNRTDTAFELKIGYRRKKEIDGVFAGDGVASQNSAALFFPVALPRDQSQVQVWKINPEDLSHVASGNLSSGGGLFAPPNSVALSGEYVYAMIDNEIHVLDQSLQKRGQSNVNFFYTFVSDIDGYYDSTDCYLLGMKQDRPIDTSRPIWYHYLLGIGVMSRDASGVKLLTIRDISLDSVRGIVPQHPLRGAPTWVSTATFSPMAISPVRPASGTRKVAVGIHGGLFVVDGAIKSIPVQSAGREEDIIFNRDGRVAYCLHTRPDNQGLLVSRVNVDSGQVQSLSLPRGEGPFDVVGGQQALREFPNKNQRAASVARTPEENLLFVSHGKSIFKIENGPSLVHRETYTMELPCRIFHVAKGRPTSDSHAEFGSSAPCNLVYALGGSYRGDGKKGSGFTHLYKIAVLDK